MSGTIPDPGLRQAILAGLERTIWTPPAGVGLLDRLEAVQLLGQFRDPAAGTALFRVLSSAIGGVQPRPLGRLLHDTALDTLLRSPAQPAATLDAALARYYAFWARLRRHRLERNVIYDDIPVLARYGRLGLVLRAYVLPLVLLLVLLSVPVFLLDVPGGLGLANDLVVVLALLCFVGVGLGLLNLHQVLLVLAVAWLGPRLPLPRLPRLRVKAGLASILAVLVAGLALYALQQDLLIWARHLTPARQAAATTALLLLPWTVLPCYMLAHDFEAGLDVVESARPGFLLAALAVVLRWLAGATYLVYVYAAFGLVEYQRLLTQPGFESSLHGLAQTWPWLGYLLVAPLLAVLLLGVLGRLQRLRGPRLAGGRR